VFRDYKSADILIQIGFISYILKAFYSKLLVFLFCFFIQICQYADETQKKWISLYLTIQIHECELLLHCFHLLFIVSEARLKKFLHIHGVEMERDKSGILISIFCFPSGYETLPLKCSQKFLHDFLVSFIINLIDGINTDDSLSFFGLFE